MTDTADLNALAPCPFCGVKLVSMSPRYIHPETGCLLDGRSIYPFENWNTRALTTAATPPSEANHVYHATIPPTATPSAVGRFNHHPDPAIDFCVEVEEIKSIATDRKLGVLNPDDAELEGRIERAMKFTVGGDPGAVTAKDALRSIELILKASAAPSAGEETDGLTRETHIECRCGWRGYARELLHDKWSRWPKGCCPNCQSQSHWKQNTPEASGTAREAPSSEGPQDAPQPPPASAGPVTDEVRQLQQDWQTLKDDYEALLKYCGVESISELRDEYLRLKALSPPRAKASAPEREGER